MFTDRYTITCPDCGLVSAGDTKQAALDRAAALAERHAACGALTVYDRYAQRGAAKAWAVGRRPPQHEGEGMIMRSSEQPARFFDWAPDDPRLTDTITHTLADFAERLEILCVRRRRLAASDDDSLLKDLEQLRAAAEQMLQKYCQAQ